MANIHDNPEKGAEGLNYGMQIGSSIGGIFGPVGEAVGMFLGGIGGYAIGNNQPYDVPIVDFSETTHYSQLQQQAQYSPAPIFTNFTKSTSRGAPITTKNNSSEALSALATVTQVLGMAIGQPEFKGKEGDDSYKIDVDNTYDDNFVQNSGSGFNTPEQFNMFT